MFVILTFSKLFEGIVTVNGEDLSNTKEEKSFYDLVYESIELQQDIFKYLISKYEKACADDIDGIIQLYLSDGNPMNKLLSEEIGSFNKSNIDKEEDL